MSIVINDLNNTDSNQINISDLSSNEIDKIFVNDIINIPLVKGEPGVTGPKGDANTLTIGTVEKGEEASATITGEAPNQVLNLVLPKGDEGEKGETGDTGPAGESYDDTEVKAEIQDTNNKIENLSKTYKNSTITAPTIQGFGKIHKLFGKTEEVGSGEKSPSNPYEISCVGDSVNIFNGELVSGTITDGVPNNQLNATRIRSNSYIEVENNQKYIINAKYSKTLQTIINFFDSSKNLIGTIGWTGINFIFETPNNTKYLMFVFRDSLDETITINDITEVKIAKEIGSIKIISTDGTNTSNKVISCKPLCCLKDTDNNIVAQDYIDFDRQKIHRECEYIILNGTEEWSKSSATDFDRFILYTAYDISNVSSAISNMLKHNKGTDWLSNEFRLDNYQNGHRIIVTMGTYGSLTLEQFKAKLTQNNLIIIAQKDTSIEEDIEVTNSIVQYQNETTISNSENAEMEIELTNNKAISSINKSIAELQEKDSLAGGYGTKVSRFTSSNVSTNSTSFQDIGASGVTLNVKKDNSTVLIFAKAGGIYTSNLGYEAIFDVVMDNGIHSTSGPKYFLSADYRGNITADGSSKVPFYDMFVFTDIAKGTHEFKLHWKTHNAVSTVYSGYYASVSLTAIEI